MRDDPRAEADLAEQTNVSGVPKDREGDQTNADTQTNQAMRDDPRAEADLAEQTNVSRVPKDREGDLSEAGPLDLTQPNMEVNSRMYSQCGMLENWKNTALYNVILFLCITCPSPWGDHTLLRLASAQRPKQCYLISVYHMS